ncbi:hypothetical protein JCM19236_447 [Vibrio sp. JCM 19236]|nr:hypothetical protein JCM19236_447 [Vibrio sp. JCM 19236]
MKNFLNIIASSNEPNPLYIDQSDRRWFAIKTELPNENESKDHADNQEYTRKVSEFAEWARTEQGIRVIRHFLTGIILDDWDTRKPPMTQAKQSLLDTSVSIAEDIALNMDFASPIVRRKDVFNSDEFKYQSIGVGKQEQILASVGCQRVQGDKVQIQGLGRQRDFWITPIGLELGIKPDMTGSQISELIKPHVPDFMETVFT